MRTAPGSSEAGAREGGKPETMKPADTFETLRARIRARFDDLSPHLQRLARLALEDPNRFAVQTIAATAADADVQPSALIRFARAFGYDGFSALQQVFKLRLIEGAPTYREQVYRARSTGTTEAADASKVLSDCVDDMTASLNQLKTSIAPERLARAIDLLAGASHVYVAGLRRSRPIAAYLAYGLMRIERPCSILDFDGGMAAQQVANMRSSDVLAAIAFSEYAPAVVDVVRDAYLRGLSVIAVTDLETSPLARDSSVAFLLDETPTAPFRPISGPLALVQTLVVCLSRA